MLSCAVPLALLISAFIVICADPELRDAEPAPGRKLAPVDGRTAALLAGLAFM